MKKLLKYFIFISLVSCGLSEKKVYKNLYITNGGEFQDYPVVAIKLDDVNQLNIFPFEVKDYRVVNKYIIFKCIDYYEDEKFYLIDKSFNEYNYEQKITGPLNRKEFESLNNKESFNIKW